MPNEHEALWKEATSWDAAMAHMDKKPQAQKQNQKESLWNAGKLAQFANAESQDEIERFRARNDDFLPPDLWTELNAGKIGIAFRNLPGSGEPDFPLRIEAFGPSGRLRSEGTLTVRAWTDLRDQVRLAWDERFATDRCILLLTLAATSKGRLLFPPSPFQKSVMLLALESWRARFCSVCGHRFVADKPATRFCSLVCTGQARRASRNTWWKKNGKKWREKTRKQKRKSNVRTHRRPRAERL